MIHHSKLTQMGEVSVKVLGRSVERTSDRGAFLKVPLAIFDEQTGVWTNTDYMNVSEHCASILDQHVGSEITIVASGTDRDGSDHIEVLGAHHGPAQAPARQHRQPQREEQAPRQERPMQRNSAGDFASATAHVKQAANLMRLCLVEAAAIGGEAQLDDEHVRTIASSLFISAERAGMLSAMPVQALNVFGAAPRGEEAQGQDEPF